MKAVKAWEETYRFRQEHSRRMYRALAKIHAALHENRIGDLKQLGELAAVARHPLGGRNGG